MSGKKKVEEHGYFFRTIYPIYSAIFLVTAPSKKLAFVKLLEVQGEALTSVEFIKMLDNTVSVLPITAERYVGDEPHVTETP